MTEPQQPLVSIATPVYNGEKYLAECIESVLGQTYGNWEYVIVNNCSTDRTEEIVRAYQERDSRIRLKNNERFLKQIENFNEAARGISDRSKYCCLLMADDWLYAEFFEKMVALAEKYPSVGIVSAYQLEGTRVKNVNIPYTRPVLSGSDVGRSKLLELDKNLFGSTSTFMVRSEIIRASAHPFDVTEVHSDMDFVLRVLQKYDFGFVHQVLSYTRLHSESTTAFAHLYATTSISYLSRVIRYGRYYLGESEYRKARRHYLLRHHRQVVRKLFSKNGREIWNYHSAELKRLGCRWDWGLMARACVLEAGKWFSFGRSGRTRETYSENETVQFKKKTTV